MRSKAYIFLVMFLSMTLSLHANIIPVETLFKQPTMSQVKISPDGKHLAATVEINGQKELAILDAKTKKIISKFNFPLEGKQIGNFGWFNSERIFAEMETKVGPLEKPARTGYMFASNIDQSKKIQLLPAQGRPGKASERPKNYEVVSYLRKDPEHILIMMNRSEWTDVYKLNIYSGTKRKIDTSPEENANMVADNNGVMRISVSSDFAKETTTIYTKDTEDSDWRVLQKIEDKKSKMRPLSFTKDNKKLYFNITNEDKKRGIYLYDLSTKNMSLVKEINGDADITRTIFDNDYANPEMIGFEQMPGYIEQHFFDKKNKTSQLYSAMSAAFPTDVVQIINYTEDGNKALVRTYSDKNPATFYLFNQKTGEMEYLLDILPWIDPQQMASMKPISFEARDGLEIRGYLTLPNGKSKNLPMVLVVHGGPYGPSDNWGYNPEVQFLANRGYAVLQINYRGSGGRGYAFEKDNYRKVGAEMQDDLTDGTLWAVKEGIADKNRICIYGASYGGYASMMGVVKEPDLYKCAIPYVGVYDIKIQTEESDTIDWEHGEKFLTDAWNAYDKDFVRERSPIYHLDKLKAALFLVHGEDDPRCPIEQYEALAKALDKMKYPYESMVKDHEGHGFRGKENIVELYTRMAKFLEKHIGK